jgi:ABC-type multidrug transport system ATPase subunit
MLSGALLHIKNLDFSYGPSHRPDVWSLRIDDFFVQPGVLYLVKGNNMSGKSTFLNIIAGLVPVDRWLDCVFVNGGRLQTATDLRSLVTVLSNSDEMFPELSIWDNIRVALPRNGREVERRLRRECEHFLGLSDVFLGRSLNDQLAELSTGGRALVKLCRAHCSVSRILVVDELSSYLDDERARFFLDSVLTQVREGVAAIVVSHSDRDRSYLTCAIKTFGARSDELSIVRTGNLSELQYER